MSRKHLRSPPISVTSSIQVDALHGFYDSNDNNIDNMHITGSMLNLVLSAICILLMRIEVLFNKHMKSKNFEMLL